MSKLIVYVILETELRGGAKSFPCSFLDELRFSSRIGEAILIASVTPGMEQGYAAVGTLSGFSNDSGGTLVWIEDISAFPSTVAFVENPQAEHKMSEVADDIFDRTIAIAIGEGSEEAPFAYNQLSRDDFSERLRQAQGQRCGFSDVVAEQGEAFFIRPPALGGRWHTSNFLFLDQQPGILFASFAWTVGPRLELIIDTYAAGAAMSRNANQLGMLAVTDAFAARPDRDALAWHREQFFARLRG